jgi:hypothetical protein
MSAAPACGSKRSFSFMYSDCAATLSSSLVL